MDDCVLIHHDKTYLSKCLEIMQKYIESELNLTFNAKTQITPIKNGVDYLGYHFYVTNTGKIIKKVRRNTKYKFKRKMKSLSKKFSKNEVTYENVKQVLSSYIGHLKHGYTFKLRKC